MRIFITGVAGFIGFHVAKAFLSRGDDVVGLDNLNDYYDPNLKQARLDNLNGLKGQPMGQFTFIIGDISEGKFIHNQLNREFDRVINLAAQAGVRKSLQEPQAYVKSNIEGFVNILEACRYNDISHLVYASTSSVYGMNTKLPFSESDNVDHPIQLYAATKRSNELMAHAYSHLFSLPTTGLRFFTVYGPWGRPDMALFLFTKDIIEGKPIKIFNNGEHARDFTYIDDIVSGVVLASDTPPGHTTSWKQADRNPSESNTPFQIFNIGNGNKIRLEKYIEAIEEELGIKANRNYLPLQPGDVKESLADINKLSQLTGYKPKVDYKKGVAEFIKWYKSYY